MSSPYSCNFESFFRHFFFVTLQSMTVPNFISKAFSYQDLRREELCAPTPEAWPDKNTLGQIELKHSYPYVTRNQSCFGIRNHTCWIASHLSQITDTQMSSLLMIWAWDCLSFIFIPFMGVCNISALLGKIWSLWNWVCVIIEQIVYDIGNKGEINQSKVRKIKTQQEEN